MKLAHMFMVLIFLANFISCKKDELNGDLSIFVGNWEWYESLHSCTWNKDGTVSGCTKETPGSTKYRYRIKILENGSFRKFKNDRLVGYGRIQISRINSYDSLIHFTASTNNGILQLRRGESFTFHKHAGILSVSSIPIKGSNHYTRK